MVSRCLSQGFADVFHVRDCAECVGFDLPRMFDAARKSWVTVSSRTFLTSLGRSHAPTQRTPKRVALRKKIALLYRAERRLGLVPAQSSMPAPVGFGGIFDTSYKKRDFSIQDIMSSFLLLHVISFGGTWIMSQCLTSTGATSPTTRTHRARAYCYCSFVASAHGFQGQGEGRTHTSACLSPSLVQTVASTTARFGDSDPWGSLYR